MPKRERYVFVCTNRRADDNPKGSCAAKGSEAFQQKLKSAVAEAGLHARVRVTTSGCLDTCWMGISLAVMPDMTFFGRVTDDDIPAMVEAFGGGENVAEHPSLRAKVLQPNDFDEPKGTVKLGVRRPA